MSRGDIQAAGVMRIRAVAGCLVLAATAVAATAVADDDSTKAAAPPARTEAVDTARFEAFVQEVGIDISALPFAVRSEWARAPRLDIDDCAVPGRHAGHEDGPRLVERAVQPPEAAENH